MTSLSVTIFSKTFTTSFCLQKITDVLTPKKLYTALHFFANLRSIVTKKSALVAYIA